MSILNLVLGAGAAFLATAAGAAGVLPFKCLGRNAYAPILSFCAGVMMFSASEMLMQSRALSGDASTLAAFLAGLLVFLVLERTLPHAHMILKKREITASKKKAVLLAGTITLHNIPEGFAIASAFSASNPLGWLVALSIAIQDIPEGFVISAPLACYGMTTKRSFLWGALSGAVEFAAAIVGFLFLSTVSAATPFALAFSAGAMGYIAVIELLLDALKGKTRCAACVSFILGLAVAFSLAALLAF